jgi:hypothetical protein
VWLGKLFAGLKRSLGCSVAVFVVEYVLAWFLAEFVLSSFVVLVFVFVFAGSRSQMDKLVSWLPKPILMLFEGGAA